MRSVTSGSLPPYNADATLPCKGRNEYYSLCVHVPSMPHTPARAFCQTFSSTSLPSKGRFMHSHCHYCILQPPCRHRPLKHGTFSNLCCPSCQAFSSTVLSSKGWFVHPQVGRLTMFDGTYLHGVVPGRGPSPQAGE